MFQEVITAAAAVERLPRLRNWCKGPERRGLVSMSPEAQVRRTGDAMEARAAATAALNAEAESSDGDEMESLLASDDCSASNVISGAVSKRDCEMCCGQNRFRRICQTRTCGHAHDL